MKRLILLITAFSVIAGSLLAGPELTIENRKFFFGNMPQHSTVTHYFWFKSTGDDTLKITEIKTGCTCALMPLEKDVLPPGDSMLVGFYWETKNSLFKTGKYPYIFTNVQEDPFQVMLTGTCVQFPDSARPVSISPYKMELSVFSQKSIDSLSFKLTNHSNREIDYRLVSFPVEECEISFPEKLLPNSSATGYVKVKKEYLDKEFIRSITIMDENDQEQRITIPIRRKIYK